MPPINEQSLKLVYSLLGGGIVEVSFPSNGIFDYESST